MIHLIKVQEIEIEVNTGSQTITLTGEGTIHPRKILSELEKAWREIASLAGKRFPDLIVLNHSETIASENVYKMDDWSLQGKEHVFGRQLEQGQHLTDLLPNYA
jgi:hypothetical protein